MATKIPAAQNRMFKNAFVCKVCKHKMKFEPLRVMNKSVRCRKCRGKQFRIMKKK